MAASGQECSPLRRKDGGSLYFSLNQFCPFDQLSACGVVLHSFVTDFLGFFPWVFRRVPWLGHY
jgi:hypothetical protein